MQLPQHKIEHTEYSGDELLKDLYVHYKIETLHEEVRIPDKMPTKKTKKAPVMHLKSEPLLVDLPQELIEELKRLREEHIASAKQHNKGYSKSSR